MKKRIDLHAEDKISSRGHCSVLATILALFAGQRIQSAARSAKLLIGKWECHYSVVDLKDDLVVRGLRQMNTM